MNELVAPITFVILGALFWWAGGKKGIIDFFVISFGAIIILAVDTVLDKKWTEGSFIVQIIFVALFFIFVRPKLLKKIFNSLEKQKNAKGVKIMKKYKKPKTQKLKDVTIDEKKKVKYGKKKKGKNK